MNWGRVLLPNSGDADCDLLQSTKSTVEKVKIFELVYKPTKYKAQIVQMRRFLNW